MTRRSHHPRRTDEHLRPRAAHPVTTARPADKPWVSATGVGPWQPEGWSSGALGHVGVVVTVNPTVVEDYNYNFLGTDALRFIGTPGNAAPNWYLHR